MKRLERRAKGHAALEASLIVLAGRLLVVAGRVEQFRPSSLSADIAARLPHGRLLQRDDLDHFGPMTHPADVADIVLEALA